MTPRPDPTAGGSSAGLLGLLGVDPQIGWVLMERVDWHNEQPVRRNVMCLLIFRI
jgi:hypothetical protein